MILLHDMINRRVVISLQTYYTNVLRTITNTNAMTGIEGENVGIMILFDDIFGWYILTYCILGLTMVSVISTWYFEVLFTINNIRYAL